MPAVFLKKLKNENALPYSDQFICSMPNLSELLFYIIKHSIDGNSLLLQRYAGVLEKVSMQRTQQFSALKYSKHLHIRTLILEVRLIRFLYIGCLVKNQPEGVLKLFLKIGGGNQNCNKYTKKSLRLN